MPRGKSDRSKNSRPWLPPFLIVFCGVLAYCNSLGGPFIYDDITAIRDNPDFGGQPNGEMPSIAPLTSADAQTTLTARPTSWLTFKIDYLLAGQHVEIYHLTNLLIHICAALLLFGIVRRNLQNKKFWGDRFENSADWLACAVAALWVVHPLNTESVTYIVQRVESAAGLCYLAVLYCVIRGAQDRPEKKPSSFSAWDSAAILVCVVGLTCKEIVATAPLVVFIYDRTFLAGSFLGAFRARKGLYIGLFGTWILAGVMVAVGNGSGSWAGLHVISPMEYARTQLAVVALYLRQTIWPTDLVLAISDWPLAKNWSDIGAAGAFTLVLLLLTAWSLWKKSAIGFLGTWFFLILAPTSSIVPMLTEVVAEHRMYLPLAAPIALIVVGGWMIASRLRLQVPAEILAAIAVLALSATTIARNWDYRSSEAIWADAIAKRPSSMRPHFNLGHLFAEKAWKMPPNSPESQNAARAAAAEFQIAHRLDPHFEPATILLGQMLIQSGDVAEAERFYDAQLQQNSSADWQSHLMRGTLRAGRGDFQDAKSDFQATLAQRPDLANAHYLLGMTLENLRDYSGAQTELQEAVRLDPNNAAAAGELDRLRGASGG